MPTLQEMTAQVRLLVDDPLPQKPSLRRILLAVVQATQSFYSHIENTGQSWSLKPDYVLSVSSQTSDYLLAIDDSYGKPIQVLSYYPNNPAYVQRQIQFYEIADLNFDWPYPVNLSSWTMTDGSNCTAMRMAFYYQDDGSRYVRVLPQPNLQALYLISFASGDFMSAAALETSPVLSQFHSLVETWAAMSILPSCQWENDKAYNAAHRKELAASLQNDVSRIADDFQRYSRNLIQDHITTRNSSFDHFEGWV